MPVQSVQEKLASHVLVSSRYDALRDLVERYDACQDMPFSQENLYVVFYAMFPASKFILTLRDAEAWFESLTGYHKKIFGVASLQELTPEYWQQSGYLHKNYSFEQQRRLVTAVVDGTVTENWDLQYDKSTRICEFENRNNEIIRYFRNRPSDLLCFDISTERDSSRICDFLGFAKKHVKEIPRLNARA